MGENQFKMEIIIKFRIKQNPMMKKSAAFSNSNRPTTSNKQSPQQKALINSMKRISIETKDFNVNVGDQQIQVNKLYQTIDQLIMKQKQYQSKGKYVQAQSCKRKVQSLRQLLDKQQVDEIRQRHKRELAQIQQAHIEEMNCFNIEWDKIVTQLHQQISRMQEDLIKKHQEQIMTVEQDIDNEKPKNFKESPQLLNLRKIEQQLAKQQNYMEAHQVQRKAEKLQKEEIEKWKKNNQSKGKSYLNVLRTKQDAEMSALRQKIQLAIDEKQRQRKIQEQRLILKYENVIKELMFQQNQEVLKCEKVAKLSQLQKKTKPGQFGANSRASFV